MTRTEYDLNLSFQSLKENNMTRTEYIYEVHSDVDENNIYAEFGTEQEALDYARNNVAKKTWVDEVEVAVNEYGDIVDETGRVFIWSYKDDPSYKDEFDEAVEPAETAEPTESVEVEVEIDEPADGAEVLNEDAVAFGFMDAKDLPEMTELFKEIGIEKLADVAVFASDHKDVVKEKGLLAALRDYVDEVRSNKIEEDVDPDVVVKVEYPEGEKPEINIVDEVAEDEQFSDDEIVIKDEGIEDEEAEDKVKVEVSTPEDPDTAEMAIEPADFDEMIRFLVKELEEREEAIRANEPASEEADDEPVEDENEFDLEFDESMELNESSLNMDSYRISDSENISYGWDKYDGYYVRKTYQIPGELYSREDYYETYATEEDAKKAYDRLVAKYSK